MKKTILLTSLIAVATMAATTGTVKGFTETEAKFTKTSKEFKAEKIGVEAEVKVKDTGFSFAGTFQAKDLKLNETKKENLLNNSKVWAKYELPEINGVNSYVKATINPKFVEKFDGKAELEGQVDYKINKDVKVGLNSKTTFPFTKSVKGYKTIILAPAYNAIYDLNYGANVTSTQKIFVEANTEKITDIKAHIAVTHSYSENEKESSINPTNDLNKSLKNIEGHVEAKYNIDKKLELEGKVNFKKNFADKDLEYKRMGETILVKGPSRYMHSYELKGVYKGMDNLTFTINPFVTHINIMDIIGKETDGKDLLKKVDAIYYGTELEAKYKTLNDKLTLTGKSLLLGSRVITVENSKWTKNVQKTVKENGGIFKFGLNAKYDHSLTDKLVVSPELDSSATLRVYTNILTNKSVVLPKVLVSPKVTLNYKASENLNIKGSVEVPINFGIVLNEDKTMKFDYKSTAIKGALNIEYNW